MSEDRVERNQVFSPAQQKQMSAGVSPLMPTHSLAETVKADFGLDVPSELVPVPSRGLVYPKDSPMFGKELIEISPMTAREEDILTSQALLKKGTVISELIRSCLLDKSVDPTQMLVGDRNALMVAIRITGYGADYDAETTCPSCSATTTKQFNLAELTIRRMEIEPVAPGVNLFEFLLPSSKKRVKFRFLTGRDEEEIVATQDRMKKTGLKSDNSVTTNLMYSIMSIEGIDDRTKISQFIRMMPAKDSMALRMYMRDNEPGIIMKQEVSCSGCGGTEEVNIPLGVKFLWPAAG